MHYVTLRIPRGHTSKTETVKSERMRGGYVRLYSIRTGQANAHPWAKDGREGALGPVIGYGVTGEDADGILKFQHESERREDVEEHYAALIGEGR